MNGKSTTRRIVDIPCNLLDAVLCLSFDHGELENVCASTGTDLPCRSEIRPILLRSKVHAACHADTALSRRITRILDFRFASELEDCRATGVAEYARAWFFDAVLPSRGFAGALWAIGRVVDSGAECVAAHVNQYVTLEAFLGMRAREELGAGRVRVAGGNGPC